MLRKSIHEKSASEINLLQSDVAVQGTQVTLSDLGQQQTESMEGANVEASGAEQVGTATVGCSQLGGGVATESAEEVEEKNVVADPKETGGQVRVTTSLLDEDQSEEAADITEDDNDVAVLAAVEQEEGPGQMDSPEPGENTQLDEQDTLQSFKVEAPAPVVDLREEEARMVGGEIMFARTQSSAHSGWDNLRWMAYSGVRKVRACEIVYRYFEGRTGFLWSKDEFELRKIAVYENPNLILVLRSAQTLAEFLELMELPKDADVDENAALRLHFFVESVIDPKTCKLRLSPLTTVTSILPDVAKESVGRRSCFELITPFETVPLSAVKVRQGTDRSTASFTDSGAFLETSGMEFTLAKCICAVHDPKPVAAGDAAVKLDLSWKHQIVLGTLHSYVVIGNQSFLDMAIMEALHSDKGRDSQNPHYLNSKIVDAVDECDKTALHYACISRFSGAVNSLVKVGADAAIRVEPNNMTPCHICAINLDFKSLAAILAINRRPNVLDALGRTPIYLAISEGRAVGGLRNPEALDQCITIMEKYGGEVDALVGHCHPVCYLAARWEAEALGVVLSHCAYNYPIRVARADNIGISMSARFQYPMHAALVSLRQKIKEVIESGPGCERNWHDCSAADTKVNK